MSLRKLYLTPDQSGYSVADGADTLSVKLDGGLSRYRKDVLGAASSVGVQWTVGPTDYAYLRSFYRTAVARGTEPFLVDLILDDPLPTEHEAYFEVGSMKLSGVRGFTYTVQASLEVKPVAADAEFDVALVEVYEAYGPGASGTLDLIAAFMRDDVSRTLGA